MLQYCNTTTSTALFLLREQANPQSAEIALSVTNKLTFEYIRTAQTRGLLMENIDQSNWLFSRISINQTGSLPKGSTGKIYVAVAMAN
jgi:hypothetical protein